MSPILTYPWGCITENIFGLVNKYSKKTAGWDTFFIIKLLLKIVATLKQKELTIQSNLKPTTHPLEKEKFLVIHLKSYSADILRQRMQRLYKVTCKSSFQKLETKSANLSYSGSRNIVGRVIQAKHHESSVQYSYKIIWERGGYRQRLDT